MSLARMLADGAYRPRRLSEKRTSGDVIEKTQKGKIDPEIGVLKTKFGARRGRDHDYGRVQNTNKKMPPWTRQMG